jgi:pSer/pThr/pTyr-binding forkhead associated (FHA) protein
MEPIPVLSVLEGALTGHQFEITTAGLGIGREPGNEIVITDSGVSRQHARVILHNGMVWVQDVGSRNGVFVNGNRVPDHKQVKPGDKITVGLHVFQILMHERRGPAPILPLPAPSPSRSSLPIWVAAIAGAMLMVMLLLAALAVG